MNLEDKKFLILGCGSIGGRHLKNLVSIGARRVILCDRSKERIVKAIESIKGSGVSIESTTDFDKAVELKPFGALICTPSSMHLPMSLRLAKEGVHLFIEKPLSHNLDGVGELIQEVDDSKVTAMMAMCYRFHPVFEKVREILERGVLGKIYHVNYFGGHYLPDWHPNEDYREEYAAQSGLGGGVVLTSIHGFDNMRFLFGDIERVTARIDRVSNLQMDVEDIAFGTFQTVKGTYISWEMDFLQRAGQHRLVLVGAFGTLRVDLLKGIFELYEASRGDWEVFEVPFEINTMYVRELEEFIRCIKDEEAPGADLREGYLTLKLALEVKEKGAVNV